jgi:RNA polymerase sigma factor (sigma-70 family)
MGAEERDEQAKIPPQGQHEEARHEYADGGAATVDGAADPADPGQVPGQGGTPLDELLGGAERFGVREPAWPEGSGGGSEATEGADSDAEADAPYAADAEAPPASDAELTAAVRAGDDAGFEELYRRHSASVRRYARTCCRDSYTAEDLAGEVFARTLQALRAGRGPNIAVRAYLLTAVRNIAATWSRSSQREQLVDDFAVFAANSPAVANVDITDPGADERAVALADQSMVVEAFLGLDETDRMVIWHTAVEDDKPQRLGVMLGKTANAAAVQAHRARDRLAAAFLQAHIASVTDDACERHANRLGQFARGALRKRASADLREHLEECDRCSGAYLELVELNGSLRQLLPGGVLVWVGAGYFTAAATALGGVAVAAGGAAAGGAAATAGSAGAAGAAGAAGGAAGGSSSGGAAGGAAAEGLGTPAKAAIAAGVVVAAGAGLAFALAGGSHPKPQAARPAPHASAPAPSPTPAPAQMHRQPPPPAPRPTPKPTPKPAPRPAPKAAPRPKPTPKPTPKPAPASYYADALPYSGLNPTDSGGSTGPGIDTWQSSPVWQRKGDVRIGGTTYRRGITVHAPAETEIGLNRSCRSFAAMAGLDDMTMGLGAARFSVLDAGSGRVLWSSGTVRAGHPAVPVHAALGGVRSIRLVVSPVTGSPLSGIADVADWADARFSC